MDTLFNYFRRIFQKISLEFCDNSGEKILNSREMKSICKRAPEWKKIIQKGLENNLSETFRTLRHIFRSLWVYFAIMEDRFSVNISEHNLAFLRSSLNKIYQNSPDLFPLLLLYHDVGRPFNKEWHSIESANLIEQDTILNKHNLSLTQQLILYAAIKYHLFLGTIFTGESSYYGMISLYKDEKLVDLWQSKKDITLLFDILTCFTIIDIWGYDYSKIFDHYFKNYYLIRNNLVKNFVNTINLEVNERKVVLFERFSEADRKNLKWRISCALRIFQFVNTGQNLTENAYYNKIGDSLKSVKSNWENFVESLEGNHAQIQFKYALPLLMLLASGSFKREPIFEDGVVNPKLFRFWQICCHKITLFLNRVRKEGKRIPLPWNFIFTLPRNWFFKKEYIDYIKSDKFFDRLRNISPIYNKHFDSYIVDFKITI